MISRRSTKPIKPISQYVNLEAVIRSLWISFSMPSQDKLQQLNLANFYGSVLEPTESSLLGALRSGNPLSIDYSICSFFESYWWLSLGVELDYFPDPQARTILTRHFNDRQAYRDFLAR